MKQKQTLHRRATGLLLAAVALPFTPALAQDTVQPTEPPIVDVTPPPVTTPEAAPTVPQPTVTTPSPVVSTPQPTVSSRPVVTTPAPSVESTPVRQRTVQRSTSTATRQRAAAPARTAAPAVSTAPAATAPLAATPPITETAAPETLPVETLPETAPAATDTVRATPNWTLIAAGAAMLIALLGFLGWRRRRTRDEVYDDVVEERTVCEEPIVPVAAPIAAAPAAFVPAAAAAEPEGEPQIEFEMRPVRAGVGDEDARVDFELAVANRGSGPARDVRVSAWMLGSGSPRQSEIESALIERVDIDAGEDANVEASVALPRAGLGEDAILPVVVTEARYRRPDGSEGRATATYEVGVPDGDEMIYFDVENPSGLHDGVVAREVDELETA
jgi:LPXTG-motif cell wall-anchored protein